MVTQQILSTVYEVVSSGTDDTQNLYVKVEINKGTAALSGKSEAEILGNIKAYLQSISTNPISVRRIQTIQVDGL